MQWLHHLGSQPQTREHTGQARGVAATPAHTRISRYEYGSKDVVLVAMTKHPVYKNVFISILDLGFCRDREAWEMEVPSKLLKAVHTFGKVRS